MSYLVSAAPQLGATLRGMRKLRRMTQHDVAHASGLRQKTVSLLETEPHRCSVDSLMRYLSAVRVNISLEVKADGTSIGNKGVW